MQYRADRYGNKLSILGYGCMRFSRKGSEIDLCKAEQELMYAIDNGVNYLDTAYVYPGSEEAVGEILERNHCRDRINLATKLPHYMIRSKEGAEKRFREQLARLKTDHIDYYLMHMLNDAATWEHLCALGIDDWIRGKREAGQIRQIGFSYHGNSGNFKALLNAYDWDFCQIQYNYLDENTQAGREGLQYAGAKGIPVIIMEPLRGGRLAESLPKEAEEKIAQSGKFQTAAELAFRWLFNQPQVSCVLSGMNSMEMLRENLRIADNALAGEFTEEDLNLVKRVVEEINKTTRVGCTACAYCMPCPHNVDIPMAFHCYNVNYAEGGRAGLWEYAQSTALRRETSSASQCVGCARCEQHCPQGIPIRKMLKEASQKLEPPWYKAMKWAVHTFHIY